MSKDNKSGKNSKSRYNLRDRKGLEKKKHESSDSSDNSDHSGSESEGDMNSDEYQKFLSKIFPSKHMSEKIEQMESFDKSKKINNNNN